MSHRKMFLKYTMGFAGYGMAVPGDIAAQMARKKEAHAKCKILDIPFDNGADIDELERKCRLAASGGVPTCVDDLPAEKRAEVIGHIALMNAAGIRMTKDDVSALMRWQPMQRVSTTATDLTKALEELSACQMKHIRPFRGIVPAGYIESAEQRQRRQTRNKRKAAKRKATGR